MNKCGEQVICKICGRSAEEIIGSETPPTDELERLIEKCNKFLATEDLRMWDAPAVVMVIKLLAERITGLDKQVKIGFDFTKEIIVKQNDRIVALENELDKAKNHIQIMNSQYVTLDNKPNPQALNPLTREEIILLIDTINELARKSGLIYPNNIELRAKFESYLGEK